MNADEQATRRDSGGTLFGAAGLVMALCCLAGPVVLGAVAGAAMGDVPGLVVAVLVAVLAAGVVVLYRRRSGKASGC